MHCCWTLLTLLLLSSLPLQAESLAPIVEFLPECKQEEVIPLKTTLRVRNSNLLRFSQLRDVPEVARYLQQIRENASARRFDAVLLQQLKQSEFKAPGSNSEVHVQLEMFRFCDGNDALSDTSSETGGIRQNMGTLEIKTSVNTVVAFARAESEYKVVVPPHMHVSLTEGAMGVKPKMTAGQVQALWGTPSADLMLQDGSRLLGYGRRLWVLLDPLVKVVFTDSEILSGVGRNLLEFHPEFDEKLWLIDGKVPYKQDMVRAGLQLGSWQKKSALLWRRQLGTQQLSVKFEQFNPESVDKNTALLTGFRLSAQPDPVVKSPLQQAVLTDVLTFVESVNVRNLRQQPLASQLLPNLRVHQLAQRRNLIWWMPTTQLHVLINKDNISRLKVTTPIVRNPREPDQIPQLLKALQIPVSKAGLRLAFPDMQDYGDRFQLYRDDFDIVIEFASDEEQAPIELLEIIYHYAH
ncbi:hypothetical protein ATY27_11605 [Rheinheimera sp. F8]|nr:hypothetical protein ATY27_05345 [Rheinheimera sp. F8]ALZ76338.1 hypothetical protein ATY27_11605 [Rheinheimera sp. F8]